MIFVRYRTADNAQGQLLTPISAAAETIVLKSSEGDLFPDNFPYICTLEEVDVDDNVVKFERVKVTAKTGDTFTVTRGFGGDTAVTFAADDYFSLYPVSAIIDDIQAEVARLEDDKLDVAEYQNGNKISAASSTGTDAYAITLDPAPASYATTQTFRFLADVGNTGPATLNVNGLGAITIKKNRDQDLETGDIEANQIVTVSYDGTNFQMDSQVATLPTVDIDVLTEDTTGDMTADYLMKSNGTTTRKILVNKYMASDAEALAGTVQNKFVNPKQVKDNYVVKSNVVTGSIEFNDTGLTTMNIPHGCGKIPRFMSGKLNGQVFVSSGYSAGDASYDGSTIVQKVWSIDDDVYENYFFLYSPNSDTDKGGRAITAIDETNVTLTYTHINGAYSSTILTYCVSFIA